MSFISQVSREQHVMIRRLCQTSLGLSASLLRAPLPRPKGPNYVQVEEYWLQQGDSEAKVPEGYILTPSVKENLKNLARIVCGRWFCASSVVSSIPYGILVFHVIIMYI